MSQTLADDSEVVFDQPEESAGAMEPEDSLQNRHRKETWLEATEPYRGARPRTMEFNRPVDGGLGATLGEVEDDDKSPHGGIGRYCVSYAARSRGATDRKPISEDAEGIKARALGATSSTHDDKGTLV